MAKKRRGPGYPPKLRTAAQRKVFLDVVRDGCSLADACDAVRVCVTTLKNERNADPSFDAAVKAAEADCKRACIKAVKKKKPEFLLERKWWREFARRNPEALPLQLALSVVTKLFSRWLGKLPAEHHPSLLADIELACEELRIAAGGGGADV